jgi:hypothetical protein
MHAMIALWSERDAMELIESVVNPRFFIVRNYIYHKFQGK